MAAPSTSLRAKVVVIPISPLKTLSKGSQFSQ
jgi:hypothetical protein